MKSLLLSPFIGILILASCSDSAVDPEIIVEPPMPIEVKIDSILQGARYGLTIGDNPEKIYEGLQTYVKTIDTSPYLSITGFHNTKVEDLKDRIDLYGSLILDSKPSSLEGGQIYFEGDVIKSIYNRDGKKLLLWPKSSANPLRVGDKVVDIYEKLLKIKAEARHAHFFDYIGMFEKKINKPFDPKQRSSNLWQFSFSEDKKNIVLVDLVFENQVLVKIKSRHERYQ